MTLFLFFLIPFDKLGKRPKVTGTARKWQSRREPLCPWFSDHWTTVFNDCQPSSRAGLRKLGWWGSCSLSRAVQDFMWDLFILTEFCSVLVLLAIHFKEPLLTSAHSFNNTISRLLGLVPPLLFHTVCCLPLLIVLPFLPSLISSHVLFPGLHMLLPAFLFSAPCPSCPLMELGWGSSKAAVIRQTSSLLS